MTMHDAYYTYMDCVKVEYDIKYENIHHDCCFA